MKNFLLLLSLFILMSCGKDEPSDSPANISVTYHSNGATNGVPPTDINKYKLGEDIEVLYNSGNLAKENQIFGGWSLTQTGVAAYWGGEKIKAENDLNFYATWVNDNVYLSSLTVNDDLQISPVFHSEQNSYTVNIPFSVKKVKIEAIAQELTSEVRYIPSNEVDITEKNTYVTVKVTSESGNENTYRISIYQGNYYTLTYNTESATSGAPIIDEKKYDENEETEIECGDLRKEGYILVGWTKVKNKEDEIFKCGDKIKMDKNITLYPVWKELIFKRTARAEITNERGYIFGYYNYAIDLDEMKIYTTISSVANNLDKIDLIGAKWGSSMCFNTPNSEKLKEVSLYKPIADKMTGNYTGGIILTNIDGYSAKEVSSKEITIDTKKSMSLTYKYSYINIVFTDKYNPYTWEGVFLISYGGGSSETVSLDIWTPEIK